MTDALKAHAMPAPWWGGIEVLLYSPKDGKRYGRIVTNFIVTDDVPDGAVIEPSFRMDTADAQSLMDELWQCGIRPSSGAGSAGQLAATQAHLEDMRRLVFESDKP